MTTKLHCTFCGDSDDVCDVLIRGPVIPEADERVMICDDCVRVCAELVARRQSRVMLDDVLGPPQRRKAASGGEIKVVGA